MNPIFITTGIVAQVITNMGISAIVSSIYTITSTSHSIYDTIKNMSLSSQQKKNNVYHNIKKLDLEATIKIINSMLQEIPKEKIYSKTILLCLESLKEIIIDIEYELFNLNTMIDYNDSLWVLKNFRSCDCSTSLKKLVDYKNILDNRRNLLTDCLQIKYDFKQNDSSMIIVEDLQQSNIILNDCETIVADNYFTNNLHKNFT